MANEILIIGESGTGKSTSIRTLPPAETFIINVLGKNLPFRGSNKLYKKMNSDWSEGNCYRSDKSENILKAIHYVNTKRPDIKYLIIDDFGYVVMNEFMRKALETGYNKYTKMGKEFSDIINFIKECRDDLFCFVMMHVEIDALGKTKPKTVGKMIDQHVCVEGHFTTVLHTFVVDGKYGFITNNDNVHMCKTPMDLFEHYIPNDLKFVADKLTDYFNYLNDDLGDIQQ